MAKIIDQLIINSPYEEPKEPIMKKLLYLLFFLIFFSIFVFAQSNGEAMGGASNTSPREEIDYLLFRPDSANSFVAETEAGIQLDKVVRYLQQLDHTNYRIYVYGFCRQRC